MNLDDLKKIKLTEKQKNAIVVIVLIVGAGGYFYWTKLYQPNIVKIKDRETTLEQKEKELRDARQMVMEYPKFLQRSADINKRVDFINKRLPKESHISETIRRLSQMATESNITIISFMPETKVVKKEDYKETSIEVEFNTNYLNLGKFLTRIGHIERLTIPADMKITATGTDPTLGSTIIVSMKIKIYAFVE